MVRILLREMFVNIGDDRIKGLLAAIAVAGLVIARPDPVAAQSGRDRFEFGVHVSSAISGEFNRTDVGLGGRLSWHPVGLVGIESEINLYPGDFPDARPFSRGRAEGMFGVTVGPSFNGVRPFARLRSGFLHVREAPRPYACVRIFPPLLSCALASGRTLVALDIGGGVEMSATRKMFIRADAGDRLLKYPGPIIDGHSARREHAFLSHDFRFAAGVGLRF